MDWGAFCTPLYLGGNTYMYDNYIKIKDITDIAITEEQGLQLRKEIEKVIGNNNKIILDFDGIKIFTTTFFSASIGYYILKLSPKKCRDIFVLKNISKTGKNAYQCSIDNAEEVYKRNIF